MALSAEDRNGLERSFFAQGAPWNSLPKDRVGVKSLKEFVGKLIYEQIHASLREIGNPRTSTLEQKLFVTEVEVKAREITDETFHGHYEKEIFIECENLKLRQHARALNKELSEAFIKYGNNRAFSSVLNSRNNEKGDGSEYNRTGRFIPIPREDHGILQWIEQTEASSRGYELPSLTSAYIHSRLFKDITANWEPIAEYYFQQLRGIITRFHDTIMGRTCVDEKCAKGFLAGTTEAERTSILLTENPDFIQTVLSFRDGRLISTLESVPEDEGPSNETPPPPTEIRNQVLRNIITIHDYHRALYRIARRRLVDGIIVQVFERKVLRQILDLYGPRWVIGISDEELNGLASEPQTTTQGRLDLAQDLQTFKEALFTLD
ncbi:hypothetical protein TWF217_004258 [Orbilia oligospora]|nr:hypothetical protein TWF217_004258 [Orbilia oligospora]KAF3265326.1 hypothetical protein TWF128_000597 [Orbilia oligospora]